MIEILSQIDVLKLFTETREFLGTAISNLHGWVYFILWAILFLETGFVIMPFLPGDSLLFAAGTLSAIGGGPGDLDLRILLPIILTGPFLGDSCNYWVGRLFGRGIMHKHSHRFIKTEHLDKAHAFYERHGGKAVAIGRFIPLIRTFVPFVAGIGRMHYGRFLAFSAIGTFCWINICVWAGFFFGSTKFVRHHFESIIIAIVVVTLMPAVITFLRTRFGKKANPPTSTVKVFEPVDGDSK